MVEVYSEKYNYLSTFVRQKIESFQEEGEKLGNGDRNEIKLFKCEDGLILNIKSFKVPNLINQVAYKHLRKSKARRSFEYAQKLQELGIGQSSNHEARCRLPKSYRDLPCIARTSMYMLLRVSWCEIRDLQHCVLVDTRQPS